jgi:Uma2 family endonuclease
VEVVSPRELQRDRDYITKRTQCQDLGIPEHWIVDPQEQTVVVLEPVAVPTRLKLLFTPPAR